MKEINLSKSVKKVACLFLICFLNACSTKNDEKPKNLIPKDKLVDILTEIHQAESKINNLGIINSDTTYFLFNSMQANIMAKYEVDTAAYFRSYKYYLINPDDFVEIYQKVVNKLTIYNKRDSTENAKKIALKPDSMAKQKEDSIANLHKIQQGAGNGLFKTTFKMDSIRAKIRNGKK